MINELIIKSKNFFYDTPTCGRQKNTTNRDRPITVMIAPNRIETIAIKDTEKSCYTMMRQPISRIESVFLKKEVDANYG
ncbi:hypothetical protein A9G28_05165 [Gilliamella sp. Fer1-1]|uniref:hypothetical protein n=1 Tax=Gilliamella sp. Fer1-1 TaxID=3120240 RepID=UPI00080DD14C|nr:hypothetical protein [Gilliamella apicola]OCG42527.1 hypothetical protein A9G28_05165 [Gilliamella apicola]